MAAEAGGKMRVGTHAGPVHTESMKPVRPPPPPPPAGWPCVRAGRTGVVLSISVVPGASRTELVGLHGEALRVRLAAPPVDGKANDALLGWLAEALGLPRRQVTLLRGASSRQKQAWVDADAGRVNAWLDAALGAR